MRKYDLSATRYFPIALAFALLSRDLGAQEFEHASQAVGRDFPVSASVLERCGREPKDPSPACEVVMRDLSSMAKEAREEGWSSGMEKRLAVIVKLDPRFILRAVECRETICAVEVASIEAGAWPGFALPHSLVDRADPTLRDELHTDSGIPGFERDSDGRRVTVTLETFTRQ
jgi:hypothetical protein